MAGGRQGKQIYCHVFAPLLSQGSCFLCDFWERGGLPEKPPSPLLQALPILRTSLGHGALR
eukprot:3525620-Alexandrium_andersonii.AAC.1